MSHYYVKEEYQADVVQDCHWADYYTATDVNVKWDIFEKIIEKKTDIYCPIKIIRVRSENPKWFLRELAEEIYNRDRLYK